MTRPSGISATNRPSQVRSVAQTSAPLPDTRPVITAGVVGLGTALPPTVVENVDIEARIGVEPGWIEQRTGILRRRALAPGETLADLSLSAATAALGDAGVDPHEIDLIVAATTGSDEIIPNLAPAVAGLLGISVAAYDVGAACTGFVAGMVAAAGAVESGRAKTVLLLGADAMRRWTDPDEGSTAALFGDGAGAVVLRANAAGCVGAINLGCDGEAWDAVWIDRDRSTLLMDGHQTYRRAVSGMRAATELALEEARLAAEEIDLFVYHQANRRILESLRSRLGVPADRVVDAIAEVGNTSAASLPLALAHARADGRLRPGARVLFGAAGSGFCFGAGTLTW